MQPILSLLFSPAAFAVGFLWPLTAQVLLALNLMGSGWQLWAVAAVMVLPFALMAQFRGSWLWIK